MLTALLGSLEPLHPSSGEERIVRVSFQIADRICKEADPRDSGDLYITHPVAMFLSMVIKMLNLKIRDVLALAAALNHDSLETILEHKRKTEDCKRYELEKTERALHRVSPKSPLFFAVSTLTHRKHGRRVENDDEYVLRMLKSEDFRVLWVKLEDWKHNLSTISARPTHKQVAKILFVERYYKRFATQLTSIIQMRVSRRRMSNEWLALGPLLEQEIESILTQERERITRENGKSVWAHKR